MITVSTLTPPPYPLRLEDADTELAELAFRDRLPPLQPEDRDVTELATDAFRLCPPPPMRSGTFRDAEEDVETVLASALRRFRSSFLSSRLRSARASRR